MIRTPQPRRLRSLVVGLVFAATLTPLVGAGSADAASWTCPVENRTTRPYNGGLPVSAFAVKGVDLSHWNTGFSFSSLKAAGQSFVYLKATQGTSFIDSTYASRQASARSKGLLVGTYHFFDYRLSGTAQADFFVRSVRARGGFRSHLRPVVDVECLTPLGKPVPTNAVSRLRAFVTEMRRLLGVYPIIYTSIFEWHTVTAGTARFGDCRLWSAEWAKTAPLKYPPGWTTWTFWQYGTYRLGDLRLDGNVYRSSLTSLRALLIP
jgi:GH25 family lysozyme M1 (1,4-beta-N-acetylmuramidase)